MVQGLHLIYPLSLVLGMTVFLDMIGYKPSTPLQGFMNGVIMTYASCLLVYFVFLRRKQ